MKTVALAASTLVMLSAPASSPTHAIAPAPVVIHGQAIPRKLVSQPAPSRPTDAPFVPPPNCKTPPLGWVAWYPGQLAPYILYASTSTHRAYYESPPGMVTLIRTVTDPNGATTTSVTQDTLAEWCGLDGPSR